MEQPLNYGPVCHRQEFPFLTTFELNDRRSGGILDTRVKPGWEDLLASILLIRSTPTTYRPGGTSVNESASRISGCPQHCDIPPFIEGFGGHQLHRNLGVGSTLLRPPK